MAHFAVLGATSWGVTLAALLERAGHDVTLIVRSELEAHAVRAAGGLPRLAEHPVLSHRVHLTPAPLEPSIAAALTGALVAVPSHAFRASVEAAGLPRALPVVSAAKGLELSTGSRLTQVLEDLGFARERIGALSGPNLAHEIIQGLPAAAVVAVPDLALGDLWQASLSSGTFRVYSSADVLGVELAGALKNVVAIAAGAAWGLGFGANAVAAIMTRGLAEMTRLGVALGAEAATFQGLAGVGDLAATCFSPLSRNRRFGELLARGLSPTAAAAEIGETVEGAVTAAAALRLAGSVGVELPITAEVAAVIGGERTVPEAMARLLGRPLAREELPRR
ncbi:NAD(P)H-dependent glycerol-3-phosphate dehydrogenase [Tepidiforma sp.]|uniref:NAD(P)H-dependent glycerol-3-phosphate dehydrogenase n=1 Tax=Tepidiforma sp. TaxID=2682230 RepID=UPI002ADD9740|nr:NAD(P)H-dependent glycerol-3-phosphate dehydrogenase [Tepidiforma sp.]